MVLSLVLAVLTGVVVHAALAQAGRATAVKATAPVVVASRLVVRGGVLPAGALRLARFPVDYVPPGAFSRIKEATGRVALADLAPGEVVTKTRLICLLCGSPGLILLVGTHTMYQ
jgi:Flp pilus assembly protein CpaB